MRRDEELERFKEVNLTVIAAELGGYEIVRKKSTRHSVLMDSGRDKIIVSKNGSHYIYCSVHNPDSNGTAIDFVQNVVETKCSLGRVRQHLRPFLNSDHVSAVKERRQSKYAETIQPSSVDFLAVAARFSRFDPIEQPHSYLCVERRIPFELLERPRLAGLVRHSSKYGSIIFPHWGQPASDPREEARGFTFKYERLLGASVDQPTKAKKKGEVPKETSEDTTRRLFYVTCSRSKNSLAVVAYTKDCDAVRNHAISKQWFEEAEIVLHAGG